MEDATPNLDMQPEQCCTNLWIHRKHQIASCLGIFKKSWNRTSQDDFQNRLVDLEQLISAQKGSRAQVVIHLIKRLSFYNPPWPAIMDMIGHGYVGGREFFFNPPNVYVSLFGAFLAA